MMCFPDIYSLGTGGLHDTGEITLGAADYIKTLLQSRISKFRFNIKFIFYQFYQACLQQIASGIYHKLHIICLNEKITAG